MNKPRRFVVLIALCGALIAAGQAAAQAGPRRVAEAYMLALQQADWQKAVVYMHPHTLSAIHRLFITQISDPGQGPALKQLFKVDDLSVFHDLTPEDFFVRFMAALNANNPALATTMQDLRFTIEEMTNLENLDVLVRYRISYRRGPSEVADSDTMILRQHPSGWKIYSTPDLEPLLGDPPAETPAVPPNGPTK